MKVGESEEKYQREKVPDMPLLSPHILSQVFSQKHVLGVFRGEIDKFLKCLKPSVYADIWGFLDICFKKFVFDATIR